MVAQPSVNRLPQRTGIERVEPGPTRPFDADKSGFLQHVEMLCYRLTRECHSILRDQKGANLEQRLFWTLAQAIDDPAAGRVAKRLENAIEFIIVHPSNMQ